MTVHISGRGLELAPALRRRVELRLAKVTRLLPKLTEARVVLALERHRHLAEVTVQAKGATLHAEAEAADFHAAVDLAIENLQTQVRRRKDRIRARKPRASRRQSTLATLATLESPAAAAPPEVASPAADGPEGAEILEVVVRRLAAKPMSVDEALEQMRARRDGLLIFTNARSRALNVLHRRADGLVELVQPTA
jgi:putative sigma-54 modulation protein